MNHHPANQHPPAGTYPTQTKLVYRRCRVAYGGGSATGTIIRDDEPRKGHGDHVMVIHLDDRRVVVPTSEPVAWQLLD
jgi:hypothetical protein